MGQPWGARRPMPREGGASSSPWRWAMARTGSWPRLPGTPPPPSPTPTRSQWMPRRQRPRWCSLQPTAPFSPNRGPPTAARRSRAAPPRCGWMAGRWGQPWRMRQEPGSSPPPRRWQTAPTRSGPRQRMPQATRAPSPTPIRSRWIPRRQRPQGCSLRPTIPPSPTTGRSTAARRRRRARSRCGWMRQSQAVSGRTPRGSGASPPPRRCPRGPIGPSPSLPIRRAMPALPPRLSTSGSTPSRPQRLRCTLLRPSSTPRGPPSPARRRRRARSRCGWMAGRWGQPWRMRQEPGSSPPPRRWQTDATWRWPSPRTRPATPASPPPSTLSPSPGATTAGAAPPLLPSLSPGLCWPWPGACAGARLGLLAEAPARPS